MMVVSRFAPDGGDPRKGSSVLDLCNGKLIPLYAMRRK